MSKRKRSKRSSEALQVRRQLAKQNKDTMVYRWKNGYPRAYYPLLQGQENQMEIWIGDAVNLCKKCSVPFIYDRKIAIVVDIISSEKIQVRISNSKKMQIIDVSKVRFDSRIVDKYHTFKRLPFKF